MIKNTSRMRKPKNYYLKSCMWSNDDIYKNACYHEALNSIYTTHEHAMSKAILKPHIERSQNRLKKFTCKYLGNLWKKVWNWRMYSEKSSSSRTIDVGLFKKLMYCVFFVANMTVNFSKNTCAIEYINFTYSFILRTSNNAGICSQYYSASRRSPQICSLLEKFQVRLKKGVRGRRREKSFCSDS